MNNGVKRYASEEYVDNALANIGGDSVFVVNVIGNDTDGYVADKTYEEIGEAYTSEKQIYAVVSFGAEVICQLGQTFGGFKFYYMKGNNNAILIYELVIKSDNSVTFTSYNMSKNIMLTQDVYSSLTTTDKTIVGSINEVNEKVDNALVDVGGDSVFVVTVAENEDGSYSMDKTFDEITEVLQKKQPVCLYDGYNFFENIDYDDNSIQFERVYFFKNGGTIDFYVYEYRINKDNTITYYSSAEQKSIALADNIFNVPDLTTESKSVYGAINELNEKVDNALVDSSGDATFVVTVTGNDTDGYVSDKTFEEITEARNNNKNVIARLNSTGSCYKLEYITSVSATFIAHKDAIAVQSISMNFLLGNLSISVSEKRVLAESSNMLTTESKSVLGAINELNAKHTEGTDQLILLSPNGTRFEITVGDDGVLTATEIVETTES